MDGSSVRRGKPCWYKEVGLSAINDSILLESLTFLILEKRFQDRPKICMQLFTLFRSIIFKTSMGQALDLGSSSFLDNLNAMERYSCLFLLFDINK